MDGLTSAQIRIATVTALQASSAVTALVPSASIVASRSIPPTAANGPSILIWTGGERGVPGADYTPGMACYRVESDVIIDFTAPEVGGDVETLLDAIDVIVDALLSSQTWMALWTDGAPDYSIPERWRNTDGERFWGQAQVVFGVRHLRGH